MSSPFYTLGSSLRFLLELNDESLTANEQFLSFK